MFTELIICLITLLACIITFFKWKYSHWRNKGLPYLEPCIPFGTSENPFARKYHPALLTQKHYEHLKALGHKCGGLYFFVRPSLLLVDLDLIRNVMSKDFHYFMDRGTTFDEKNDPMSANLFNLEGQQWRHLRAKITPTFTSGRIKMMFPTLVACGEPLLNAVDEFARKNEPIDTKDVLARFTTDVIGSCAFGLDCNSFKEPESDFRKYGKMIFSVTSKLDILKAFITFANPKLARAFGLTLVPPEPKKFFLKVVEETVTFRKANNVVRNDFIQLLMNLEREDGEGLTIQQIAAQAFIFWFAGFETSSTTMTFCLYELAINQELQDQVRQEVTAVFNKHNELTYESVMEMKFLGQVVDETLRKYPPGAMLPRKCVQDYQIPDTDICLQEGCRLVLPIYALHHDPEYFPNPEKFDPSRFSDENKSNIRPFTYMPFGEGPRNCIGLRFGLLQTKMGLIMLLKRFKFKLSNKMKMPVQFDKLSVIISIEGGVWLDVERVS